MSQKEKNFGLIQGLSVYAGKGIKVNLENNEYPSMTRIQIDECR